MPSTFFGLHIAASGLNAAQVEINTTANNISNVETDGYSKQVVNVVASSALRVYQRYGSAGTGVEAKSVTQLRDQYYDEKYWNNQGNLGFYEKKQYYMNQIESYYSETNSATGFATIYAKMFNALDSLKTNAGDTSYRKQFISTAQELCTYFNSVSTNLENLQSSVNDEIKTTVDNINSISKKIALLNKQINILEMEGGHANELRDQRAMLLDDLSKIADIDVKERQVVNSNYKDQYTGATYFTVKINGQLLVDNYEFNSLSCVAREERFSQSDIEGLYDIVWTDTNASFSPTSSSMNGSLKAMFEVRDGNNAENLRGTVRSYKDLELTISGGGLTITELNKLNLPSEGSILVNSTYYGYDSFTFTTDPDGNIESYTFHLKAEGDITNTQKLATCVGKQLVVGDTVDFMGIPYYMNQMNEFLRNFCEMFNNMQSEGVDLNGDSMKDVSFFVAQNEQDKDNNFKMKTQYKDRVAADGSTIARPDVLSGDSSAVDEITGEPIGNTYYLLTARNVGIDTNIINDASKFSTTASIVNGIDAYDIVDKMLELQSKIEIFRGGGGDKFLQCIYSDVTVDTQECTIFTTNYTNIQSTISNQRQSISGVDNDEEALNLVKFQNAYNLASKCISVFSEIYDQLILNTGM